MDKKVVLKQLTADKYLSLKSDAEQENSLSLSKYTFHPYNWMKIARFDTEEEAMNAFADFCRYDKSVTDVALVSVFYELP